MSLFPFPFYQAGAEVYPLDTCYGDLFSVAWMENAEAANLLAETLQVRGAVFPRSEGRGPLGGQSGGVPPLLKHGSGRAWIGVVEYTDHAIHACLHADPIFHCAAANECQLHVRDGKPRHAVRDTGLAGGAGRRL